MTFDFELSIECNVLPMKTAYIVFGRPKFFYEGVQYDKYENTYTPIRNSVIRSCNPLAEILTLKQPKEKLTPYELEEISNTFIRKQVEATRKKEDIVNNEFKMQ